MRRVSITIALLLLAVSAFSQTYTAASCSYADVNDCVNSGGAHTCSPGGSHTVVNGDTVKIPAGTCTWTSKLLGPSGVNWQLLGTGTPNSGSGTTGANSSCANGTSGTLIIDNYTAGYSMIEMQPSYNASFNAPASRVSCLSIDPLTSSTALYDPILETGTCTSSGCPAVRLDNITFGLATPWGEGGNSSNAEAAILAVNVFGVIDHTTIGSTGTRANNFELFNAELGVYLGSGQYGDNSWEQPDSLGGANNLFVENNIKWDSGFLAMNDCEQDDVFTNRGGCRIVMRYNTMHQGSGNTGGFGLFQNHGTESGGRARGGREAEVYNNTILCEGTTQNCSGIDGGVRSGTGLFYNNATTSSISSIGPYISIQALRSVLSTTNPFSPQCGGFSPWDANGSASITASSTVTNQGAGTITDTSQTWTAHQFKPTASGSGYMFLDFTPLSSNASVAFITDNTATQLSIGSLAAGSVTIGDTYYITGTSVLYTGANTSVSNPDPNSVGGTFYDTMTDSGASFSTLLPSGAPYSVCDLNRGWCSEITSFTGTSISVAGCSNPPNGCTPYGFASGDSYAVTRSTVCLDQSARGQQTSTVLSGDAPTPVAVVTESIDPIYHWGDSISGATPSADVTSGTARLISYRDFYTQSSGIQTTSSSPFSCNGSTGGTGWGTLVNRPSSCSGACSANNPGCGYWATDTSTLYAWQSGSWTIYYQPYTYPHPLDIGTQASTPTFSPVAGTYTGTQSVTISTSSSGAIICYNTTGSPATNGTTGCQPGSTLYVSPVTVSATSTLYAVAGGTGYIDSSVGSAAYTINASSAAPAAWFFANLLVPHQTPAQFRERFLLTPHAWR